MKKSRVLVRLFGAVTILVALLAATLTAPSSAAVPAQEAAAPAKVDVTGNVELNEVTAASCRRVCYGFIFVNAKSGKAQIAYNYASKAKAKRKAFKGCKRASKGKGSCVKAVWAKNACMAVAYRFNSKGRVVWAADWHNKLRRAKKDAKRRLKAGKGAKKIWIKGCTAN